MGKQHNQNADNRQAIDDEYLQAIHEEVVQLVDILRHTRQQCTGLALVVIRKPKFLQLCIQLRSYTVGEVDAKKCRETPSCDSNQGTKRMAAKQ